MRHKNHRNLFTAAAALLLAAGAGLNAATVTLDLRTALERAPEANFQILLSEEAIISQEQATRIARSGLLPQVYLEASQSRGMSPNVDALTSAFPGIPSRFYNDRFDAVLRAQLSLLDTRRWDDWKLSRLSLQATRLQVENTVQEILQQIAVAYFTHWRNQRRLNVIDANLERDRLLLRIANDQQQAGVATALDVTRAEVRLATNELARLQQETQLMGSALRLKRVLNIDLDAELALAEVPLQLDRTGLEFSPSRFVDILNQRADYRQAQAQLEREAVALGASKRDRLPSLSLSGQWGYASESWTDDMEEQWAVSLGLSMPIFEGFRIDSQTRVAASALRQRELEVDDLSDRIEADYRLALQTVQSGARQVEVARRAVALNEREFELARIRFEEGVADNSDVVTAQAALADAEDARVEAEFQYLQARISLARIEGDVRSLVR
jgi:outer membrane protein TolC